MKYPSLNTSELSEISIFNLSNIRIKVFLNIINIFFTLLFIIELFDIIYLKFILFNFRKIFLIISFFKNINLFILYI